MIFLACKLPVNELSPWNVTGPANIDSNAFDAPPITVNLSVNTTSENVSMVVFSSPTTFN